jgi:23S rRNA pseudouridine1911/1915/1917 synthase
MQRKGRFQIPRDREGQSLLDFLCSRFPYHTAEGWRERIAGGSVRVNGETADPDRALRAGDVVEYVPGDVREPEIDSNIDVVHRDRDLLVINKSGNLPCHPGGRYFNHTLWAILKTSYGLDAPAFVNRLDRETSGIVLVALSPKAAQACRSQFENRSVQKRYVVLVEGAFPVELTARGRLRTAPLASVRRAVLFEPEPDATPETVAAAGSEWAETRFRRIALHGAISAVEVIPTTGRLHQIRATLRGLGYPVVGDKLYGVDPDIFARFCTGAMTDTDRSRLRMGRQALHAASLRITHPRTRREVLFEAPLPADMALAMAAQDRETWAGG